MRPNPSGRPTVLELYRCRTEAVIVREPAQLGMDIETVITTLMGVPAEEGEWRNEHRPQDDATRST